MMAGVLISKRNHSKVVFEAHRPLVSAIPNSTFWRIPRELLTKCPGSSRAHHLIEEESATSEGKPSNLEALRTFSSPLWVVERLGSFLVEPGADRTDLFTNRYLSGVDIAT